MISATPMGTTGLRLAIIASNPSFRRSLTTMLAGHWPGRVLSAAHLPSRGTIAACVIAWGSDDTHHSLEAARRRQLPILLLGAPPGMADRLASVTGQPDGSRCLQLPVHPETLVAALRDILERLALRPLPAIPAAEAAMAPVPQLVFSPIDRRLGRLDQTADVMLTETEVRLLGQLWQATAPLGRNELLAAVWGYSDQLATHTLATHIYRLRRKLSALGAAEALVCQAGRYWLRRA